MDAAYSLQQLAEQALRHHYGITTAQLGRVASHSFMGARPDLRSDRFCDDAG